MDLDGKIFFKKGEKLNSFGSKGYNFKNYAERAIALANNFRCVLGGE